METKVKLIITIDKDLEDIVPGYLENRKKDVILLPKAVEENDFDSLVMIGHRMKGSGAGYGFQQISDIGNTIEQAATLKDLVTVRNCLDQLIDYLGKIEVVYE